MERREKCGQGDCRVRTISLGLGEKTKDLGRVGRRRELKEKINCVG